MPARLRALQPLHSPSYKSVKRLDLKCQGAFCKPQSNPSPQRHGSELRGLLQRSRFCWRFCCQGAWLKEVERIMLQVC